MGLCEEAGWMRGKEVEEVKDNRGGKFVWANFGEALSRMLTYIQNSEHNRSPTSHHFSPTTDRAEDMEQRREKRKNVGIPHTAVLELDYRSSKETKSPPPNLDRFLGPTHKPNKITASTA